MTSPETVTVKMLRSTADRLLSEAKTQGISISQLLEQLSGQLEANASRPEPEGQLELDLGLEPVASPVDYAKPGSKELSFGDFARLAGWDDKDAQFMFSDLCKRSWQGPVRERLSDGSRVWTYRYLAPWRGARSKNGLFVLEQKANGLPSRLPGLGGS